MSTFDALNQRYKSIQCSRRVTSPTNEVGYCNLVTKLGNVFRVLSNKSKYCSTATLKTKKEVKVHPYETSISTCVNG